MVPVAEGGGPAQVRKVVVAHSDADDNTAPRQIMLAPVGGATPQEPLSMPPSSANGPPISLSARLAAAKPVTWRGQGDLGQYTWTGNPMKGTWLVIDLWAGYSGLVIAMLCLGVHCYALAAECNPVARECAAQVMPHIVHVDAVEKVNVRVLRLSEAAKTARHLGGWRFTMPG